MHASPHKAKLSLPLASLSLSWSCWGILGLLGDLGFLELLNGLLGPGKDLLLHTLFASCFAFFFLAPPILPCVQLKRVNHLAVLFAPIKAGCHEAGPRTTHYRTSQYRVLGQACTWVCIQSITGFLIAGRPGNTTYVIWGCRMCMGLRG